MTGAFETDVEHLRRKLLELGGLAEEQLANALSAVRRRDLPLSASVIETDHRLDAMESAIEELAMRTLALRQPLALELRETIATLKVASSLERIGDLAKSIARRVLALTAAPGLRAEAGIQHMGRIAQAQLAEGLNAYATRDVDAALELWRKDVDLDELYNSLFRDLLSQMAQEPRQVGQGAHLLFVAKNLERVGDHTTLIAEMTHYVTVGSHIREKRPKGEKRASAFFLADTPPSDVDVAEPAPRPPHDAAAGGDAQPTTPNTTVHGARPDGSPNAAKRERD